MVARKKRAWIIASVVFVLAIIGSGTSAGMAFATGGDDDQPITGQALEKCTAAALAAYPGGTVTETEIGDDGAAYGVEVRLQDGSQIEVHLDKDCEVIGQEPDDDGPNDQDGPDDD